MKDLFFWKEWPQPYRSIYLIFLALFIFAIAYYSLSIARGENNALEWLITSTMETVEVPVKKIPVGLFELELNTDNYLINQYYQGSAHQITPVTAYVFLSVFSLCLITLLTICTYLKKFWYFIGMAAMCFILVNFRFEQLEIFGWIDNTFLLIVLGLILPVSYYFQSFNPNLSFPVRFFTFLGISLIISVAIFLFSEKSNPFYFLINYNHTSTVVLSIFFIIIVSHEIIYLILFIISGSQLNTGRSNTKHFVALSIIYLLNVGLLYLRNAHIIDWDIIYVNAFLLLLISSLIGIWGFKQRENLYQHLFPFRPVGAILFITLGITCFSTIAYHTATQNDPVLETFEDAIVYSHIGFGSMFFLYILANFINLLSKGLAVYKVAYKEDNMPYFSTNIAGLVIVAAFYYLSNQAALQQAISGYYNGLGSVYLHEGDLFLAEEYYKTGAVFGYNNHRSNYSIGELAYRQDDLGKAIARFKNATLKNPTEYAFINLANAQKANYQFFDGLFTLKDGLREFPGSEMIKNNLGLIFKETNVLDSAIYYMESGASGFWGNKTNQTNIIDVLARNRVKLPEDSLVRIFKTSDHLPVKSNLVAYSNSTGHWLREPLLEAELDSTLNIHQFAYLNNFFSSKVGSITNQDQEFLERLSKNPLNATYRPYIEYLRALLNYYDGNLSRAFRQIDPLQNAPLRRGYYNHVMGVIALEQQAPRLAADFFAKARDNGFESAPVNLAIALTESKQIPAALGLWNKLLTEDSLQVANDVIVALTAPLNIITNSDSDALKYQAIRYRSDLSLEDKNLVQQSIIADQFKIAALNARIEDQVNGGNYDVAKNNLTLLKSYANQYEIEGSIERLETSLLHYQVADEKTDIYELDQSDLILNQWENSNENYFRSTGYDNPFKEDEVIIASRFFKDQLKNRETAYDILLKAIEINPYSPRLLKSYILEAIDMGLEGYAEIELEKLSYLIGEEEFNRFKLEVEAKKAEFEDFTFPIQS